MKKTSLLLLVLGIATQIFAQLSTKQVVGTWNYTVSAGQRELTGSLSFIEKEGKLTGEVLAGQEGYTFPLTKIDLQQNDSLYFEFVPENEAIKFTVKVEGEIFNGSGTIFGNSVGITGEKTEAQFLTGEKTGVDSSAGDLTVAPPSTEDFNNIDLSKFENTEGAEYFFKVKAYADYMITHGRDRYGKEHSPLFATTIDRETGNVYHKNPPDAPKGIRNSDRTWRGSNTSKDNGLYSILYKLTEITGDERYAQVADYAIKWFFAHCQNPETGFMAWGEHIGWDFFAEAPIKVGSRYLIHEYKGFNYWDRVWKFNPDAAEKFALGLWEHQVYAHEGPDAGEFSRHARYDRHGPGKGRAFPGHGGNFMGVWAKAYQETGKEVFLTAIETLLYYYERNTTDKGAILYASDYPEQYSLSQSLNLASNLYRIMDLMPADLAKRMKKLAEGTDKLYLSFEHDPSKDGKGFLESANLLTLEPGEFRPPHVKNSAWTEMWSAGYGVGSGSSSQANSCYSRYKQTGIEEFKILFMKSAEAYFSEDPPPSEVLYPSNYSSLYSMMRNAYELTGEERFLAKAKMYMGLSVETFLDDKSPLPKASNQDEHYEAITGGPGLMNNLLSLWMEMNNQ